MSDLLTPDLQANEINISKKAKIESKAASEEEAQHAKHSWLKVKAPNLEKIRETTGIVKKYGLNTVCEEAACPNIGECWTKKHATFMILGSVCTRACAFCNVQTGLPDKLDPHEPEKVAKAVRDMGLSHIVITSVDRDDLDDGGANHFSQCIAAIRETAQNTTIEILTPDFRHKDGALEIVIDAQPDVFNHNVETVPSLYQKIRPGARYFHSLNLLKTVKERNPEIFTKSGIMVGLGETNEEIYQVMDDFRSANVDFMTIGQYLRPTPKHAEVKRYVKPKEFETYKTIAKSKGFLMISSSPLTRSSYHAGDDFKILQKNRRQSLRQKS